ncbi:hypothetical protein CYMTET_33918 [Cymbomonas tetramitiformis]|uniref:Uncharacterized protein n=1 Tax=Cymbomonas tetramitiformis TaxID=36881 RepID=A0AAE0FCN5_9CHLO|nr:hypothetical protein CYMTET_33918 [Cymbomonas tetramitiformis]
MRAAATTSCEESSSLSSSELDADAGAQNLENRTLTSPPNPVCTLFPSARAGASDGPSSSIQSKDMSDSEQAVLQAPEDGEASVSVAPPRSGGSPSSQVRLRRKNNRSRAAAATAAKSKVARPTLIGAGAAEAPYPKVPPSIPQANCPPGSFPSVDIPDLGPVPTAPQGPVPVPSPMWGYFPSPGIPPPGPPGMPSPFPSPQIRTASWDSPAPPLVPPPGTPASASPHWHQATADMPAEIVVNHPSLQIATQQLLGIDNWKSLREQMVQQQLVLTQQVAALRSCIRTQRALVNTEKSLLSEEHYARSKEIEKLSTAVEEKCTSIPAARGSVPSGPWNAFSSVSPSKKEHSQLKDVRIPKDLKRGSEENTSSDRSTVHNFGSSSAFSRPCSSGNPPGTFPSTSSCPPAEASWYPQGHLLPGGDLIPPPPIFPPSSIVPQRHPFSTSGPSPLSSWRPHSEERSRPGTAGTRREYKSKQSIRELQSDQLPGADLVGNTRKRSEGTEQGSNPPEAASIEASDFLPNYPYRQSKQPKESAVGDIGATFLRCMGKKSNRSGIVVPKPKGATEQSAADILMSLMSH